MPRSFIIDRDDNGNRSPIYLDVRGDGRIQIQSFDGEGDPYSYLFNPETIRRVAFAILELTEPRLQNNNPD